MSHSDEFSIEITAEEGRPDGLLSIKKVGYDDCGVLAYVFPRHRYVEMLGKKDEASRNFRHKLDRNGLYILWGPCIEGGRCKLYIGQAKSIELRVNQHNKANEWPWDRVVAFTTRSGREPLNGTQLDYLEAQFYERARSTGKCDVTNKLPPKVPRSDQISDRGKRDAAAFFKEAISFLPMIGINAFLELDKPKAAATAVQGKPTYTIEDHPFLAVGRRMRPLFKEFSKRVVAIDSSVVEVFTKFYVSYKVKKNSKQKNFVSISVQDKKILVYLEKTRDELDDPNGLTATSRGASTWGEAGKCIVSLKAEDELPAVIHLIRQSFVKVAGGM